MGKTCAICGAPSGNYPLCKKHYHNEAIVKCEKCGHWYNNSFGFECPYCFIDNLNVCAECGALYNPKYGCPICNYSGYGPQEDFWNTLGFLDPPQNNLNNTCLICGDNSGKHHFCSNCYYKFKNKVITLRINKFKDITLIENGYESPLTCEDGHPVKSQQEALIDNYLFNHNIRHIYEKSFPIDNNKEHDLHPDFYLPDLDIYIEHWGIKNNPKYEETKEYKIPYYKKAKITLICTNSDDITNLSANLERKLKFFERGKINWLE